MTSEALFFFIPIIFFLILFLIPLTGKFLANLKSEFLHFSSGYVFFLISFKQASNKIVLFNNSWEQLNIYLIILALLLGLIGILISSREKEKRTNFSRIETELKDTKKILEKIKLEYYKLCNDMIKDIFSPFFISSHGNGRVSLYKHSGQNFKLLGRYSQNPEYQKKGIEIYPDNEGFIAKGWCNKTYKIDSIPQWDHKGSKYKSFIKKTCNISDNRINKINMKSRAYYVYRLDSFDSQAHHGVAVFETIDPEPIDTESINTIFKINDSRIVSLFKSMKSLDY